MRNTLRNDRARRAHRLKAMSQKVEVLFRYFTHVRQMRSIHVTYQMEMISQKGPIFFVGFSLFFSVGVTNRYSHAIY